MKAHLWVDAPMPPEYVELYLIREVYHAWPLPDPLTVGRHLVMLAAESEVRRKNGG